MAVKTRLKSFNGRPTANPKSTPKIDLTHITIVSPARPSRESEIIQQYHTLRKYREFGKKKEDFAAAYEREVIERYEQLDPGGREDAFELLKQEYQAL